MRTPPALEANGYQLVKELGQGSFGKVYLASSKKHGIQVAIKTFLDQKSQEVKDKLEREIGIAKLLHHPNIVRTYGEVQTTNETYLVLELATKQDLDHYIFVEKKRVYIEELRINELLVPIISAVAYMNGRGIGHRDIKPANPPYCEYEAAIG